MNFVEEKGYPLSCDVCHAFCGCQLEAGSDECIAKYASKPKQTNGDKFRIMSDEEIAKARTVHVETWFYAIDIIPEIFETYENAYNAELTWLKQESEVGR